MHNLIDPFRPSDIVSEPGHPFFQGFGVSRGEGSTKLNASQITITNCSSGVGGCLGVGRFQTGEHPLTPIFDISVFGGAIG